MGVAEPEDAGVCAQAHMKRCFGDLQGLKCVEARVDAYDVVSRRALEGCGFPPPPCTYSAFLLSPLSPPYTPWVVVECGNKKMKSNIRYLYMMHKKDIVLPPASYPSFTCAFPETSLSAYVQRHESKNDLKFFYLYQVANAHGQ